MRARHVAVLVFIATGVIGLVLLFAPLGESVTRSFRCERHKHWVFVDGSPRRYLRVDGDCVVTRRRP